MAFFHQLRLLLWKNGLNAVRQPLWSLTLISWPLLIFIILAVTRTQFPASVRDTCYVGPRNLPSTGFFPFLQTLMCNSDSICHGKSLESSSKSTPRKTSRSQSSGSPLAKLFGSDDFLKMSFPKDSYKEAAAIIDGVKNLIGASQQRRADGMSVMRGDNSTGGQYDRKAMVESVNRVKRVACTAALHAMNMTSPNRFTQGVVQYCTSNTTLLEAVIKALNRMLTEETMTNPEEMVMVAGAALSILSELQNHTALWEGLLSISRLADKPSAEEALHNLGLLSVTLQSALHVIEDNIPGSAETLSVLHPFLTVAINVINYTENWPGRGLKVKLADVVSDDSTWSDMVKMVLKCGEIPLDKAIFLALDKKLACSYLCNNTDFMGSTLCKLGAVDMAMDLISTEKLVKQILHLWSKHVASRDVAFIRGQLHSLMGGDSPGGKGGANRVRRSLETQPQSVDQELFLDVGKVVLDVMDMLPPLNMIAKNVLRLGYLSMNSVTFGLDLLQDMLQGRWKDGGEMEINMIDEVIELLMKVLMGKPVTCEDAVAAFEGFVTTDNATMEFTRRLICQDTSELLDYLPRDWHHFLAMIRNLTLEEEDESVPLPMILSAWQKLDVTAAETGMFLSTLLSGNFSLSSGLDAAVSENLQHSLLAILVSSGKNLEKSDLWPVVRNYVFMTDWVLKYQPGETMQRPNCSLDPEMVVHCGGDLNWQTFNGRFLQTLMSRRPATLLSLLKGTVALLEHVYGGTLRQLAASSLQQISTADATDLIQTLRNYLSRVINDSNQNTVDPQVMLNVTKQLFQSIGLTPFVPLLTGESPPSFSDLLGATTQFGRLNKHVLNLNGMDPIMPELERIMMMFLSTEGNLTMSIPHMLGTSLLIYSFDLNPSEVARLRQAVQPFTYQGHILEVVLRAVESMKAVIDSEEGGPDRVVLHYVRQLQEFAMSLSRLRRIEKDPHGQTSQTDLAPLVNNISDYLSPTGIQMLTEAGPEAAQKMILDLFLKMLPVMLQERIPPIIRDFTELQYQLSSCDDVTNCSAGVMRIFTSLEATLKKILSSTADITVEITSPDLLSEGFRDMAECVFSLHLVPEDLISVGTFKKALEVLKMINATSSMSMSEIQYALQQLNLTMDELEYLTSFLGEVNVNDIMENAMKVPNLLKCFESEQPNEIRNCVVGMMKPLSAFLIQLPALADYEAGVSSIPSIVNQTLAQLMHTDPSSQSAVVNTLHIVAANIRTNLIRNNLYTAEVEREFEVLWNLLEVAADPNPLNQLFNTTSQSPDYTHDMKQYLTIIHWYLMQLEEATDNSSISQLLHPYLSIVQMNVAQQLAQTELTIFISDKIKHLMRYLRHPLGDEDVDEIGKTAFAIIGRLFQFVKDGVRTQEELQQTDFGESLLNSSAQIEQILHTIQQWWRNPNVTTTLAEMLQWGNSTDTATPLRDLNHLLKTLDVLLTDDQRVLLHTVRNIIRNLNQAITMVEKHGDEGMEQALPPIMAALQHALHFLSAFVELPQLPPQHDIWNTVQLSLKLVLQPNMSLPESVNTCIYILSKGEELVEDTVPEPFAVYLKVPLTLGKMYFKAKNNGPETMNQLILDQMMAVRSLLPANSTAQAVVSGLISVVHLVLEKGNQCTWKDLTAGNMTVIVEHIHDFMERLWPHLGLDAPLPSLLSDFAEIIPIVERLLKGEADQETWEDLEDILEIVLSPLQETEHWHNVSFFVHQLGKVAESEVKNMRAENDMIRGLQMSVVMLITEVAHSLNSTHLVLSDFSRKMWMAMEQTLKAAEQANGTLTCSQVVALWEPVGGALGLNDSVVATWCQTHLKKVLEAYAEADKVYSGLGVQNMDGKPMASTILEVVRSLYHVSVNQSALNEQFIAAISSELAALTGEPLSPSAQQHLREQLQKMLQQDSLLAMDRIFHKLVSISPALQPHLEAAQKALSHILKNSQLMQNVSLPKDLLKEAAMIFLSSANITMEDVMLLWDKFPGNHTDSYARMLGTVVKLLMDLGLFEDSPMGPQRLEMFLASTTTRRILRSVLEMVSWLMTSEDCGLDLLMHAVPKTFDIVKQVLSALREMGADVPCVEMYEPLVGNTIAMLKQFVKTSDLLDQMEQRAHVRPASEGKDVQTVRPALQQKPPRYLMDDIIDLFYLDYPTLFHALSVLPTSGEMIETLHTFFANPDLVIVVNGVFKDLSWDMGPPQETTINASLGVISYLTCSDLTEVSILHPLLEALEMVPDEFPFACFLKRLASILAAEAHEIQGIMKSILEFLELDVCDPRSKETWDRMTSQVCKLETSESMQDLMWSYSLEPGLLCEAVLPLLQILIEVRNVNTSELNEVLFEALIGDPATYQVQTNWTSAIGKSLGFSNASLFGINATSPSAISVGELMINASAFVEDLNDYVYINPAALHVLMTTKLPRHNLQILSWLVDLRHCRTGEDLEMEADDKVLFEALCSMRTDEWYSLTLLMARHMSLERFVFRMVLSEDMQNMVGVMLQVVDMLITMMEQIMPSVNELQSYMSSMKDLNLASNPQFHQKSRRERRDISPQATFVTISRALCSHGILALFGASKLPTSSNSQAFMSSQQREELIDRFKIPRDATPYCTNMYLDMVNTTGGAIAWAFLKPMLMGEILYTPDTPVTRSIMRKSNNTLHEFANLRKYSEQWIESSSYILKSAKLLSQTLPLLQNSLGNTFVKNFIEMQTDVDVGRMKETLNSFSNLTKLLEENKQMVSQVTTLSTLMVNISSCITFDRYRGYDSEDQLNTVAQELATDRQLFGSVIFKLPENGVSSSSTLPPEVRYTIRMHMDNVMRTDRARRPFYSKERHLSSKASYRYNRGFVYLQENIERAIIETQTGQRVTDPAVQIQPFPYPCHYRDEYLEAMSFVFPLMLMIAWILFVADFVRKLVYEKELRLHEYMKMMGVNPLSHFFAWFLECAAYLVFTIVILTLLLKYSGILGHSDGFVIFLFLCDYGLSILAFSYLVSSFFDRNYIAGLSGSLLYVLCFFPYIVVMAVETNLTFSQKSILSIFSPTCFSYASQYLTRFEAQGEGIQWSNSYISPIAGDVSSFGWLCWLMVIDSMLYFLIGAYIRVVFPGVYGIPAPWYFPFQRSFWAGLFCSSSSHSKGGRLFGNIMQQNQPVLPDAKGKGQSSLSTQEGGDFSHLPVGVSLHGLTKSYGDRLALENLNLAFYEGHVTSLLGHNGAGKTTTMSLLTGLFAPSAGSIQVYGKDMQSNLDEVRTDLGVCMQYDVLFDHMTTKEHLLLYGQIKAPHWTKKELREQVRTILEETGMYAHRHKRVGTLSGGMKRKLSISIAFIGGSRLVVLDEPTTGVDPCSRRSIWEIVIQHKKNRTIIMSSHHLDEAEILSDRIAFLERGGLKCCGTPYYLKDKLGRGYKLTLTKKVQSLESDSAEIKTFIQAHIPEAHLLECQGRDLVYSLPPFTSSNSSSYRSLLTALDANLDALHLGGYGISDTTLEEVFLQLTEGATDLSSENPSLSISESVSDAGSIDGLPEELNGNFASHTAKLTGPSTNTGLYLAWQQISAMMIKRFHHTRRDIKGLLTQILLPVLFVVFAMGLGSIRSDLRHYPEMELSPALYNIGPSYTFFRNHDPNTTGLLDSMLSFPGIDNECLAKAGDPSCTRTSSKWKSSENGAKATYGECKCARQEQVCEKDNFVPPHTTLPSSQIAYNVTGFDVEKYLVGTTNDFIRNRYGGFDFGMQLPPDLQMDLRAVPKNRTLSKVWFNPEGHHTMPAYLNSLNNFILRANLPADKDPKEYGISVSSHPYFGRPDDEDAIVQGMLQILVVMCVLTGYSLTTASFAIYEVDEHHNGAKRLQHIAGVSEPLYWAVNFLYDMMTYMIPVTLTVAVIAAFQIPAFVDRQNLAAIFLLLVLFGFATFPWMYLLSGLFKGSEMAFITYVCINLFITVNTIMSTSIVHFMGQLSIKNSEAILEIFTKLCNAFLIFPQFSFGNGLMHLARMNIEVQILSGYGVDAYQSPFSSSTFRWMFVSLFIQGLVFFALRLLFNKSLIRKVRRLVMRKKAQTSAAHEEEDEDVTAERTRVASGAADSDILQVNQLSKVYQHLNKKKVHAVKRLSVGIPAGECFGLLGENGAGKTTTFKMLTGDVSPTDGTAQIKDQDGRLVDIMECRNRGINIGYCPQVDALDSLLTGEEHLYFYARIRGISKMNIAGVVNYLLKRLGLNYHRNIITDGYSCGTRRKLSTAMALVGHPQILLLDEPSSGMDPRTKRHLWKIISEEVRGKSAVVLTSHSMEECEALCSRLAIMVKGQFRCLGSLQHIKNRFGSGFTVKMYLAEAAGDVEAITGFMQRRFPSTYLKDQHSSMVEFHVPVAPGGVADIFDQLESNKNGLRIKNFSVSQTTLDEVFINFATGNIDMDAIDDDDNESDVGDAKSV